tara:strand:+ start:1484 stop:2230 length:747 start_codon:yes stop_codon:yes gene_type:complete
VKYITFTTKGSSEICENFLLSTRNVGIEEDIVVYCLDKESFEKIDSKYKCETILFELDVDSNFQEYGKDGFRRITESKIQIILNALQENESLVYTDCDVVFQKNPTPLVESADELISRDYDVDIYFASDAPFMNICTGFMYIKNNEKVHSLFKKYFELSKLYEQNDSRHMYDQEIINQILNENILEERIMWSVYPTTFVKNGHQYWNEPEKRTGSEAVVHVNFTIGEENKINRLKEANLWYVQEEVKL